MYFSFNLAISFVLCEKCSIFQIFDINDDFQFFLLLDLLEVVNAFFLEATLLYNTHEFMVCGSIFKRFCCMLLL